jgi:hypothetical protein
MKKIMLPLLAGLALFMLSGSAQTIAGNQTKTQTEEKEKTSFPEWAKRGAECYGIVVFFFPDGATAGHAIKSRILLVAEDQVRLRAMETVSQSHHEGCEAIGVRYGDTWWETEPQELFKTRKEAEAYLKEKGWMK